MDRVDALGGTLEVSSPVGVGTRVRAEIPCYELRNVSTASTRR
jgi:signal transduction histidine kinase